jgi:hypothetical protein
VTTTLDKHMLTAALAVFGGANAVTLALAQLDFGGVVNVFNIHSGDHTSALRIFAGVSGALTLVVAAVAFRGAALALTRARAVGEEGSRGRDNRRLCDRDDPLDPNGRDDRDSGGDPGARRATAEPVVPTAALNERFSHFHAMAARKPSEARLTDLIDGGSKVFAAKGLRRARMAEIADAAGISAGKAARAALIDLAVRGLVVNGRDAEATR